MIEPEALDKTPKRWHETAKISYIRPRLCSHLVFLDFFIGDRIPRPIDETRISTHQESPIFC